jgi:hypothetical protein
MFTFSPSLISAAALVVATCSMSRAAAAQAIERPQFLRLSDANSLVHEFCLGPCLCVPHGASGPLSGGMVAIIEADFPPVYSRERLEHIRWTAQTDRGPETLTGTGILESFGDFVLQRRLRLTLSNGAGSVFEFDSDVVMGGLPLIATSQVVVCDRYTLSIDFFLPRCPADFDADGTLGPDDLADFIAGYFQHAPDPRCDHNLDGTTDPDDLSDFIVAYFDVGCH